MRQEQMAAGPDPYRAGSHRYGYQTSCPQATLPRWIRRLRRPWSSFELRMYDPIIGRWLAPDPYAQHWSPYLAMGNNPVNKWDPDGGMDGDPKDGDFSADGTQRYDGVNGNWYDVIPEATVIGELDLSDILYQITHSTYSLETTVTIGAQVGVNLNKFVAADLSVISLEAFKDEWKYEGGELSGSKKMFRKELDGMTGEIKDGSMQVENSIALSIFGFGGKLGQKQNIDGSGNSSGYIQYIEKGDAIGNFGGANVTEYSALGRTDKAEVSYSVGAKFILGIELKIQVEQPRQR